jgi:hypothetical protein
MSQTLDKHISCDQVARHIGFGTRNLVFVRSTTSFVARCNCLCLANSRRFEFDLMSPAWGLSVAVLGGRRPKGGKPIRGGCHACHTKLYCSFDFDVQ